MDTDPWFWSVDEVLDFFRTRATAYVSDLPFSRMPDLDSFTQALSENEVSGAFLLRYIDSAFLREDCKIAAFSVRATVRYCIEKLQKDSRHYSQPDDTDVVSKSIALPPNAHAHADTQSERKADTPVEAVVGQNLRAGEHHIEDGHARKRRKLNLSAPEPVSPSVPSDPSTAFHGYFGDSALPVDELIFGDVALGEEVGKVPVQASVPLLHEDEDNFEFYNQPKAYGERQYVWSRMRHLFNSCDPTEFQRNDRPALAILPYHEKLIPKGKPRSALVVYMRGDQDSAIASRENEAFIYSGSDYNGLPQVATSEWDFLLLNHQGTEELPLYQKSVEEDVTSSLYDEVEAEEKERAQKETGFLTKTEVAEIVDQAIDEIVEKWKEKLPRREETQARIIWRKMKRSKAVRDGLIEYARAEISNLDARLRRQKTNFLADEWSDVEELRAVCNTLELTVETRQDWLWKVDVWNRQQEPSGPTQRPQHSRTISTNHNHASATSFVVPPDDLIGDLHNQQDEPDAASDAIGPMQVDTLSETLQQSLNVSQSSDNESDESDNPSVELILDEQKRRISPAVPSTGSNGDAVLSSLQPNLANFSTPRVALASVLRAPVPDSDSDLEELPSPRLLSQHSKRDSLSKAPGRTQGPHLLGGDHAHPIEVLSDSPSPSSARPNYKGDPFDATFAQVQAWDFEELSMNEDRYRLLIKLLSCESETYRESLFACYQDLREAKFVTQLKLALQALKTSNLELPGLESKHHDAMRKCCKLALAWLFSKAKLMTEPLPAKEWAQVPNKDSQLLNFVRLMLRCLQKRASKLFQHRETRGGSNTKRMHKSDGQAGTASTHKTSHKREIPRIKPNKEAQKSQNRARQREKNYEDAMKSQPSGPSMSNVTINPAKREDQESIYILPRIAQQMKPHQIEGVRFMWREIANDGHEGGQGCLLAHTMGLGKTMQTIALLVAVNEAASSEHSAVKEQLPPELRLEGVGSERKLRILIICPPPLLLNWKRELEHWAPDAFIQVDVLEATDNGEDRVKRLHDWYRFGGVLVISYNLLSILLMPGPRSQKKPLYEENKKAFDQYLKLGPEIVIADEAHKLKNQDSKTSKAISGLRTESRIGLSGTPMENDVPEIYSLLSFVAPGYLGPREEFAQQYTDPIKRGLYMDSPDFEYRKSLKKLKVLVTQTNPKINRADHTALKGVLKPKVEFVITVSLRQTQLAIYNMLTRAFTEDYKDVSLGMGKIFAWLSTLTLLTTHPQILRRKLVADLEERKKPKPAKQKRRTEAVSDLERLNGQDGNGQDGNGQGGTVGMSEGTESIDDSGDETFEASDVDLNKEAIQRLIASIPDDLDPGLSPKMAIFVDILGMCKQCGDRLLVFSSYLSTLDYLGELLAQQKVSYDRIDGSVRAKQRLSLVDGFNQGKSTVLLISTRAGGTGLNLQSANRVVIFDFGFNPAWEEQAVGRAYRIGQSKPVFVYHFVTGGTIEWTIYNKRLFKKALALRVVDHQNPPRYDNSKVREYLNEVREVDQQDVTQWAGKDPLVLDHIIARHSREGGLLNAVATMEVLQEDAGEDKLTEEEQNEVNQAAEEAIARRGRGRRGPLRTATTVPQPSTVAAPPTSTNPPAENFVLPPFPIMNSPWRRDSGQPTQN